MTLRDERPPDDDPLDLAHRLSELVQRYPKELAVVRTTLAHIMHPQTSRIRPGPVPVPLIEGEFPKATLAAANQGGVLLSPNQICLLSAEGGVGKSALTAHIALATAMVSEEGEDQSLHHLQGGIFDGAGGTVLMATYEDPPPVTRWRMEMLADSLDERNGGLQAKEALERVYVLNMSGWTVYGPPERGGYAARPAPMAGWNVLWDAGGARQAQAHHPGPRTQGLRRRAEHRLPVREFLGDLAGTALERSPGSGIILVAHSTKAVRSGRADPFDPGQVAGVRSVGGRMQRGHDHDLERRDRPENAGHPQVQLGPLQDHDRPGPGHPFLRSGHRLQRSQRMAPPEKKQVNPPRETGAEQNLQYEMTNGLGEEYAGIGR